MVYNKLSAIIIAILCCMALGFTLDLPSLAETGGHIGDHAADFTLPNVLGDSITLSDYFGSVIVLYFWARLPG